LCFLQITRLVDWLIETLLESRCWVISTDQTCWWSPSRPHTGVPRSDLRYATDIPGRRRLRSASSFQLEVPRTRLVTVGDLTLSAAISRLWNSLPYSVTECQTLDVFHWKLKHFLFSLSFPGHWLFVSVTGTLRFLLRLRTIQYNAIQLYSADDNTVTPLKDVAMTALVKSLCVYPVHLINAKWHRVSANIQTKLTDYCRKSACMPLSSVCLYADQPVWNKIPQDLQSTDAMQQFKCRLKEWLFDCVRQQARLIDIDWRCAL